MSVDDIDGLDLMPLETPILKVSRPVAACSRCRTAKIKCDGKLPACTSCERNGRAEECTSTNDQFARGKERSYVSTLETRLDKLQTKLEEIRRRKPSVVSLPDDDTATLVPSRRPSHEPRVPSGPPTPTTSKAERREEATAIDELVSGFGFLSVNATARDFYGFTTAMSYARLILSACTKDPLPQMVTRDLPPHHVTAQLLQYYFDQHFLLVPVFDKASFYASVDNVYRGDPSQVEPIDYWMLRMVLAISSATLSERTGDQQYLEAISHVCAALEHAEAVLHPGSITSVQALVLLMEYAMLDPHHFDSWSLIGVASRAMIDLGLHQDPPKGTAMSKHKLEMRRRVFWCVYCFDRSTSLVQTRAFSFSDPSAKVKVPYTRPPISQPQSPQPQEGIASTWLDSYQYALALVSLRRIQSAWYTDLFQSGRLRWDDPEPYIWTVCDEMRAWFDSVAATAPPRMLAFFEIDLLYSYVYVLSPSPRVPVVSSYAQTLIFEHCIRFADIMLQRVSDPSHSAPTTFYDAMRVYMTGRQFLDVLQQNTEGLLNGIAPPQPKVEKGKLLAPPLPQIHLPPGENVQHFNTARSIGCIRKISDCLSRFGVKWGYMSWNQRFQNETSGLLDELTGRLRELEVMAGTRRPSMWHGISGGSESYSGRVQEPDGMAGPRRPSMWQQTNSTGSVGSNNSGSTLSSPQNSAVGYTMYQSPPRPGSYGDQTFTSPQFQPQQQQQDNNFQRRGSTMPQNFPVQPGQHFNYGKSGAPALGVAGDAHDQSQQQQLLKNANPHSQFGAWGGYGGPSVPDTLDEENAQAPDDNPLTSNPPNVQTNPGKERVAGVTVRLPPTVSGVTGGHAEISSAMGRVSASENAHPSVTQNVETMNIVEPPALTEQASDPPVVQTAEALPADAVQAGSFYRVDDDGQRRSSMQDAADTIMWETFDYPGVASQAMLPPQPSRASFQGQRTFSIGQPLQLMDSNQTMPYTGKGKSRARDFEPNQQQAFTGWDQTNVESFAQLSVPYVEDVQCVPRQPQNVGKFTFAPDQLTSWQPLYPDYAQSTSQQGNLNSQARDFQPAVTQAHSHAHPYPIQAGPAPPLQQSSQTPLQQAYQPPSVFGQQLQGPGVLLYPQTEPQPFQHWQRPPPQASSSTQPTIPPQAAFTPPFRVGVGYRFRPGFGFICQVCGTVVQQVGPHLLVADFGQARWCEAAGTEIPGS